VIEENLEKGVLNSKPQEISRELVFVEKDPLNPQ